jgi:UDP-glucose 4-epimerase
MSVNPNSTSSPTAAGKEVTLYITGAAGMLGGEFLRYFATKRNFAVTAVTRSELPQIKQGQYQHSRSDDIFDASWYDGTHPNSVILHCAGLSDPRAEFDGISTLYAQEAAPHIKMLEQLCAKGWKGRLLFVSSGGSVYGEPRELPIRENHPLRPKGAYGFYKAILEQGFSYLAAKFGHEVVSLRVSNPYGPGLIKRGQGVIPILAEACRTGSEFTIIGDGTDLRDYIHKSDLCDAVERAMTRNMTRSEMTLNIGSGRGVSLNELIELVSAQFDTAPILLRKPSVVDVHSNVLCIDGARKLLDWSPTTPFETGLKNLIESLNDPHT